MRVRNEALLGLARTAPPTVKRSAGPCPSRPDPSGSQDVSEHPARPPRRTSRLRHGKIWETSSNRQSRIMVPTHRTAAKPSIAEPSKPMPSSKRRLQALGRLEGENAFSGLPEERARVHQSRGDKPDSRLLPAYAGRTPCLTLPPNSPTRSHRRGSRPTHHPKSACLPITAR